MNALGINIEKAPTQASTSLFLHSCGSVRHRASSEGITGNKADHIEFNALL
jgi:hypothetical protein